MSDKPCWECVYSIHDPLWGEYKCARIQSVAQYPKTGCTLWTKRKASVEQVISKEAVNYEEEDI